MNNKILPEVYIFWFNLKFSKGLRKMMMMVIILAGVGEFCGGKLLFKRSCNPRGGRGV